MEGGGDRSLQCDKRDGKGGGLRRSKVVKQVEEKVENKCNKKEKQVEDKWVQVSLAMSCRCCNNDNTDEGTSNTMIADMINSCCSEDEDESDKREFRHFPEVEYFCWLDRIMAK